MPKGWNDDDPMKGRPHRRVHEQIGLLMGDIGDDHLALEQLVLRIADKRPEDVLDALVWLCSDDDGDVPAAVCVTHLRFVPCRKQAGCVTSVLPGDVERVRVFQGRRDAEDNKSTSQ
jgi:hypothetical protein